MTETAALIEALAATYKAATAARIVADDQLRAAQDAHGDQPSESQRAIEDTLMAQLHEVGQVAAAANEALRRARAR